MTHMLSPNQGLNMNYSFINEDFGYIVKARNMYIDHLIPYKEDIQPRLVRFLRSLYYYRSHNIRPCVPLYMQYSIKAEDWDDIVRYIKKYRIGLFLINN